MGLGQYEGQEVYCGLSTASEVFLILLPNYVYVYTNIMQLYYLLPQSQGVYCGLSTACEVFLIFTTQLYSRNYNEILSIY